MTGLLLALYFYAGSDVKGIDEGGRLGPPKVEIEFTDFFLTFTFLKSRKNNLYFSLL
jgi:hypothetical protein